MSIQKIVLVFVLAVVAAAGWRFGQSETFQRWVGGGAPPAPPVYFDNGTARSADIDVEIDAAAPASAARANTGLHKCSRGTQVVYTDGRCPPGTREQDINQGTLTVLPGRPKPAAAPEPEPQRKTLRDVLVPPEETPLKDKQMDKIIGR